MPDGSLLHPYELTEAIKDRGLAWVGQYQLVQESVRRIVLRAVPVKPPTEDDIVSMKRSVERVVGKGVSFEIEIVDDLRLEERGKFRVYRSLVRDSEVTADV